MLRPGPVLGDGAQSSSGAGLKCTPSARDCCGPERIGRLTVSPSKHGGRLLDGPR